MESSKKTADDQKILEDKKYAKLVIIRTKLDKEIGYHYWKKYTASAFWSQISTPINLTITFLTAITTAQAQTDRLIPQTIYSQLAIISLVITTLNTFFRPHTQYAKNTEFMTKWKELGIEFEKEYYNRMELETLENFDLKITAYQALQNKVDDLRKTEGTDSINFLTDLIYLICQKTCLVRYRRWLDQDNRLIEVVTEDINKRNNTHSQPIIHIVKMNEKTGKSISKAVQDAVKETMAHSFKKEETPKPTNQTIQV